MGRVDILAIEEESGGDFSCVSTGEGDPGGVSYGRYQFSSNAGSAQEFVSWLVARNYDYGLYLQQAGEPGSDEFSRAWKLVASQDGENFENMQIIYATQTYYFPAADTAKDNGFDTEGYSDAVKNALFSASIQHGTGNIAELIQDSGVQTGDDEAGVIKAFYQTRKNWCPAYSSRYDRECERALNMLQGV